MSLQLIAKEAAEKATSHQYAAAIEVEKLLGKLHEKVVFAESCTGGLISATMTEIPNISSRLCGSFVAYTAKMKSRLLGVKEETIEKFTTESSEVAEEMALGALKNCPEASWSVSIVGHLGPKAPVEKDGRIFICVVRRTKKGNLKVKKVLENQMPGDRVVRQRNATEFALATLAQSLSAQTKKHKSKK